MKKTYLAALELRNFRAARFVAYQSEEELAQSLRLGRPRVIPNGVPEPVSPDASIPTAESWLADGALRCLFLGRIAESKGLDILLSAFRDVLQEIPQARLMIAGPDERGYAAVVERLIREHGLTQVVTMPGLLDDAQKQLALERAAVFVLSSRHEGMSVAVLEAMREGVPVVMTRGIGLAGDVERHGAGIVTAPESSEVAAALIRLLPSVETRQRLGQNGRVLALERYRWSDIARALLHRLEETR
jgi:glycosyltransferase involved in cell wall biosynthesis